MAHYVARASDIQPAPAYQGHSARFARAGVIDRSVGSVHTAIGLCELGAGGHIDLHAHSFEEQFYITDGEPVLIMEGRGHRLMPGACGVIPVGTPHAWLGPADGKAKWIDLLTPIPRGPGQPADIFFLGGPPEVPVETLDIRDPREQHFFRMAEDDINVEKLKIGSRVNAPTVSASMATALLAYSGIAVKMLVDQRMSAALGNMFMVEYQPGGIAHPHDHPLEEAYIMLHGEVEFHADGEVYNLKAGDVFWTGVGCIHAFYNRTDTTVRWLETQSPLPPVRHSYRFNRDWEYLQEKLGQGSSAAAARPQGGGIAAKNGPKGGGRRKTRNSVSS
jgi:quercetin dioxygenase-like cupin family protein